MKYCGIDLANMASAICILDEQGRIVLERTVETEETALREALSGQGRLRVVVEASPLAEWVSRLLEEAGHEVVIIDPRAAKHLVSSKKKTDARDARTLAKLCRSGWYTPVHCKSEESRERRSRLQARQALMKVKRAMNSAIRGLLRAHGIRVGKVSESRFGERVRELVREAVPGLQAELEALVEVWELSYRSETAQEKVFDKESRQDDVTRLLRTAPMVGGQLSLAYRATIDDPGRFRRAEEVSDYVGLAPRVYQSGEVEYRGRITREGDKLLRWLLVEAAHNLLIRGPDCALKRWGKRLEARKGSAKAKVAVARKLAVVLWKMWLRNEPFQLWPAGQPAS